MGEFIAEIAERSMKIKFKADSVQVRNSKIGDEVTVSFTTGMYEWNEIKDILHLNGDVIEVTAQNIS